VNNAYCELEGTNHSQGLRKVEVVVRRCCFGGEEASLFVFSLFAGLLRGGMARSGEVDEGLGIRA
jgi:hypothetical protein